jgi:hypothetical protein
MPAGPVGRRLPLKGPVTPPQRLFSALDKDELKEKCLQKVKAERARLIAKLRRERMGMVSAAYSRSSSSSMDLALEARSILAAGLRQHSSRASAVEEIECADDAAAAAASVEANTESMQECAAEEAAYRNLHSTAVDYSKTDAMQTDAQQQQQQQQEAEQLYDDDAVSTRQMLSLDEYEDMMCFIEQVK